MVPSKTMFVSVCTFNKVKNNLRESILDILPYENWKAVGALFARLGQILQVDTSKNIHHWVLRLQGGKDIGQGCWIYERNELTIGVSGAIAQ